MKPAAPVTKYFTAALLSWLPLPRRDLVLVHLMREEREPAGTARRGLPRHVLVADRGAGGRDQERERADGADQPRRAMRARRIDASQDVLGDVIDGEAREHDEQVRDLDRGSRIQLHELRGE